jgi:hypothetical protein
MYIRSQFSHVRTFLPLSILVAVLAIASCGGGDNGNTSAQSNYTVQADTTEIVASPPITKRHFKTYINGVCRKAWVTLIHNWYFYRRHQNATMSIDARFASAVQYSLLLGIDFHIFDDMHMLGSAPGEQHAIERVIGPMQYAVETGEKGYWHAHSIADLERQFGTYNGRAHRYGLDDCLVNKLHLHAIES